MSFLDKFQRQRSRVDRLTQQVAEEQPPPPGAAHRAVVSTWGQLRAAVLSVRKAEAAFLVLRTIVKPPPVSGDWALPPRRRTEPDAPRPQAQPEVARSDPPRSPPDRYAHLRALTLEQLELYSRNPMPLIERRVVEQLMHERECEAYGIDIRRPQ